MRKTLSLSLATGMLLTMMPTAFAAEHMSAAAADRADAIRYVSDLNIMFSDPDGSFASDLRVSRVEFLTSVIDHLYPADKSETCFANIAPSLPPKFTHLFSDVPKDVWYAKQVCAGMFTGILTGNKDGSFGPNKGVTVAEASKMLSRAHGLTYPAQHATNQPWYEVSLQAMRQQGAVKAGMSPSHILTRAEAAEMFYALRNTPRFPIRRLVGQAQPAKTQAAQPVPTLPTAGGPAAALDQKTVVTMGLDVRSRGSNPTTARMEPLPTDTTTMVQTRRGQKISRRALLEKVRNASK